MMIFQHTLEQVLAGTKTQTRRLVKPEHAEVTDETGAIVAVTHNGQTKWRLGGTYSVQPSRNAAGVARMQVIALRQERVTAISPADIVAEGFPDRAAFLATWVRIHGKGKAEASVWVIEFEVI